MPQSQFLHEVGHLFLTGVIFVALSALVFWPLEELLEGDRAQRPKLKDLAAIWFYQSYGLWISAGIIYEMAFLIRQHLPTNWTHLLAPQPYWLQVFLALLMAEVWVYTVHRLAHKWEFLWRFHRVHHTVVDMTWSATSRQHPVDFLLIIVGANLPALILGIDLKSIATFVVIERFYTVFLHSNLNIDWGWFSKVIASPRVHALHHHPNGRGNYAGILSFLDVLGKTYRSPYHRNVSHDLHLEQALTIGQETTSQLTQEMKREEHGSALYGNDGLP